MPAAAPSHRPLSKTVGRSELVPPSSDRYLAPRLQVPIMTRRVTEMRRIVGVALVLLALVAAPPAVSAGGGGRYYAETGHTLAAEFGDAPAAVSAGGGGRYYAETGHTLAPEFVAYFDEHGGLEILGYPITEAFVEPGSGWLIQYTENARLELAPASSGSAASVRLSALGEAVGGWQPPWDAGPLGVSRGCRFYRESGHSVCYAFEEFFLAHGGPSLFGFPISEFTLENGRIVQYFQNLRLDWRPEDASGDRVRVGALGRVHFAAMGFDPALLRAVPPPDPDLYQVTELRLSSSVWESISASEGAQRVFVLVRDQNLAPVHGAAVVLTARFPGGDRTVVMPVTDEQGLSRLTLGYTDVPPGSSVVLEFSVVFEDIEASAEDSFRVWW